MSQNEDITNQAEAVLAAFLSGRLNPNDAVEHLQEARGMAPTASRAIDELLMRKSQLFYEGLNEADRNLEQVQELLEKYGEAPLMPALFLCIQETPAGPMALVSCANGKRAVAPSKDVDITTLHIGDPVYLNSEMSILATTGATSRFEGGEIAEFVRSTSDGRIIIRLNSEDQLVIEAAAALTEVDLSPGDSVRWDRNSRLCMERMSTGPKSPFMLQQVEEIPLSTIGGQKLNLRRIQDALITAMLHPEVARAYKLQKSSAILLYGPPGNGKTSMTRAVFSEIQRIAGKKVMLAVVKASQWESMWVGQTQANITALFTELRQAAEAGCMSALFIDEVDAVGRVRGSHSGHYSDKALGTLLSEMNGFKEVENTSIVAATNRRDQLDPALTSRFGEELLVRRPDLSGAREIFDIHLEADLPYGKPGSSFADTRSEMIETAVSQLFAPNANAEVCTLKLRDGRTRPVFTSELVSGRLIGQICIGAKKRAVRRQIQALQVGLTLEDMNEALVDARDRLTTLLTPDNAHSYLDSLREDETVLGVDPVHRRIDRPTRYLHIA